MNLQEFRDSLLNDQPPKNLNFALSGLWWDAKGDWTRAHESAQQDEGPAGAWVHAYLHRKEGDPSNAAYWYQRAGKPPCRIRFERNGLRLQRLSSANVTAGGNLADARPTFVELWSSKSLLMSEAVPDVQPRIHEVTTSARKPPLRICVF